MKLTATMFMTAILAVSAFVPAGPQTALAQSAGGAEARLKELNITLPAPLTPIANYVGAVRVGNLLFVSGTTAGPDWTLKGKLGKDLTVEQGYQAARQVGLNQLTNIKAALGSLDRVKRIVKVLGMVNSAEGFGDQPKVINGFSDLMVEVFGDAGRHARSAVGMAGLPGNQPVEVELIVEVE
jgi:enamine deaminase RidA (YjgF/YER057c/UK114 family)